MSTLPWSPEDSVVSAELKRFISRKVAQVRAEKRAPEHEMGPLSQAFFTTAEKGDWHGVFDSLTAFRDCAREGQKAGVESKPQVVYPVEWAVVNEVGGALEQFADAEKYAISFGRDIIASIPPGSIYFGGTDAGRVLVTALSRSHVNGDPFFTLTQNALADYRSYLRYARGMYGSRIYLPTQEDVTKAFGEYQDDARQRNAEGKLLPGECFNEAAKIDDIRGQLAVMALNGILSRLMFEKNPEREFYVEESFPLNWMYPHLAPHGLILKINRQPLTELRSDVVERDREYWSRYVAPMIGDWLRRDTPLQNIAAFVERVYLRRDFSGFAGDPAYIDSGVAQRNFSKLRSSIGGLYYWHAQNTAGDATKERMSQEADFAFRQAFALCPASPVAVFRYINLLVGQKRLDEAIIIVESALKVEQQARPGPEAPPMATAQLGSLLEMLRRMRSKG
jgi:hypothetical protein